MGDKIFIFFFLCTSLKGSQGIFTQGVWKGRQARSGKKFFQGCISETIRCRKLTLGQYIR